MNAVWNHIAKSIFDRPDVENVSLEELDYLLEEYPYFPVIHFLRTRKVLADRLPEAVSSASRTALYFPNPHWLHYQLEGIVTDTPQEVPLAEILTTPSQAEELSAVIPAEQPLPVAEVLQEETELKFDDKRIYGAEPVHGQSDETSMETFTGFDAGEVIAETERNEISLPAAIESLPQIPEETADMETVDIENFHNEPQEAIIEENAPQPSPDQEGWDASVEADTEEIGPAAPTPEESGVTEPEYQEADVYEPIIEETGVNAPIIEEPYVAEPINEEAELTEPILADSQEISPIPEESVVAGTIPEETTMEQSGAETGNFTETVVEEDLEVPFEPLYTIDYFASQGIKLRLEEEQQNDQLSVKLRSFTEWLKAMKKIHPEKLDHKMGQEEENNIRVYAETSNEPREVYTEALAEVYLQQGLRQKALMVLEKLSLLDPSKSAYFAARIREIKEN